MEIVAFIICITIFVLSRQWIQHHRRVLIHKERVAAIEKGIALPAVEQEVKRSNWNVQRFLLLAGQIWIVLGVAVFIVLTALTTILSEATKDIPKGIQLIGIAPVGIGIAHLITYWVESRRQ